MPENSVRLFIAVTIPDDVRVALAGLLTDCSAMPDKVKWVAADNLHLTLKFLGNVPEDTIAQIIGIIDTVAAQHSQFTFSMRGLGCFPNLVRPRVLFVDSCAGHDNLKQIASDLEQQLVPLGFEPENRQFKTHITIGRFKTRRGKPKLSDNLLGYIGDHKETEYGTFTVSKLTLMQSVLTPEGPIYTPVHESPVA